MVGRAFERGPLQGAVHAVDAALSLRELLQVYAAVTRQDADGNPAGGWYPAQRMTLEEALYAYTFAPAYAAHEEHRRGRIQVGMSADLTVVDGDLVADRSLLDRKVDFTIVGGEVVFARDAEVAGR